MEGLAVALGLNPEGGSQRMACGTREPRSPLHEALRVARGARRPRSRYFLRAESFYSVATLVDEIPPPLAPTAACRSTPARRVVPSRSSTTASAQRACICSTDRRPRSRRPACWRCCAACTTSSPTDRSSSSPPTRRCSWPIPGARIYALDDGGIAPVAFEDIEHFRLTRAFPEAPDRFLRTLLAHD